MKFIQRFKDFLRDEVNLNRTRLTKLEEHVQALEDYLRGHDTFKDIIEDTIPQGSWAHHMIIKPLLDKEYDADFLLELEKQDEWEAKDYVNKLKAALLDSKVYEKKASRMTRCAGLHLVARLDQRLDKIEKDRDKARQLFPEVADSFKTTALQSGPPI